MNPPAFAKSTDRIHLVGTEWVVEAMGCAPERLRDKARILGVCDRIVADLELNVVGEPQSHQFPSPGGVTALYLLSESHLACHTYPEFALATFNLYCCRNREAWDWNRVLRDALKADSVHIRQLSRGSHVPGLATNTGPATNTTEQLRREAAR